MKRFYFYLIALVALLADTVIGVNTDMALAVTVISGVVGTEAIESTNVKRDIDTMMKVIEPYQTPLFSWLFLQERNQQVVTSRYAKYEWYEKEYLPHLEPLLASVTESSGLTFTLATHLASISQFGVDDIVLFEETDEMGYVASNNGTTLVIQHIDGSSTLTSLSSVGSYLRIIGKRVFEYHGRLTSKIVKEVNRFNYLNEFPAYITTSGRYEAGEAYTDGTSHDELVEQRFKELKKEIEHYLWFSQSKGYVTSGNERATWGEGVDGILSTNVNAYSGALTEPVWRNHIKAVLATGGSNRKMHFAGTEQMDDIELFMKDNYTLMQSPKELSIFEEFGLVAKTYRMFSGIVSLIWNPLFDGKYTNAGYTLDIDNVKLRFMANDKKGSRKGRIRPNTQDNDKNGTETEILFDLGLQLEKEVTHGKLYQS